MSKCLKCGAMLPPVGECTACAATVRQPAVPAVPSLLDRDIQIDRRRMSERGQDASTVPGVPAFADLAAHAPPPPPSVAPLSTPLPAPRAAAPPQPGVAAPRAAPQQQAAAPQPGVAAPRVAPQQAAAPHAMPPQAPPAQHAAHPGVAAPRAAPPQAPAAQAPRVAQPPSSPMTPAFGTAPVAAAPRAQAPVPQPGVAAPAPAGLPRMESAAPAPAGLPRMEAAPAPAGLPRMETVAPAPAAAPVMEAAAVSAPRAEKSKAAAPAKAASGAVEVHARPASLWRRLLSFTIDTAAIAGVAALYITLASSVTGVKEPAAGLVGLDAFVAWLRALNTVLLPGVVLVFILALVYCAVAAFLWNGRTLGRLLLGLRLVDTHGLAPAPGRAIVRAMLASVSFVLFLGGFWMALFDRRGQTLHDKLTSTFVVQPS